MQGATANARMSQALWLAWFQSPVGDYAGCNEPCLWYGKRGITGFQSPVGDYAGCNHFMMSQMQDCMVWFQSPVGDYAGCNAPSFANRQ